MLKRIFGLLGWLGVALVFAAVAIRFLKPEWQQYYNALAIAGLVCTLLYILSQWREIGQSFSGRQTRYGSLAAASVIIVVAILAAINYLSTRHNRRWDLTGSKQFSLSDQTKKVLADLKSPVHVQVFARSDDFQRYRDRLDQYTYQSKQLSVEYIDPEKRPGVAQQLGVTTLGTVVFEYQSRNEKSTSDSEQDLTNALVKVITGRTPKVYFTSGHGEKEAGNTDRLGYSSITGALSSNNFKVDKLVLAQQNGVPDDADVVVIAGPQTDFLTGEIDALKKYLAKGGKLLVMVDPIVKENEPQPAQLEGLLKDWDIAAGHDIVVDASGMGRLIGADASIPVAASYPSHPITEKFNLLTAYPLARSMTPIEGGVNGHTAQRLVETSRQSWGETDLKSVLGGKPELDPAKDKAGPVAIASAVSGAAAGAAADANGDKKAETRLVAFGDSDFPANGFLGVQGNRDLFLNTVNWLAQQENLIAIRPRDPEDRRITLTADQQRRIFYLTVLIVPGLVLLAGVQTWWRRRR
ncbi:MAG TPA: Gldg family protein [Vicinamibacterales bacterium]|jgi:ABC-type uncharacterized transport system involved in gliding motility auxiliary subunit